MKTVGDVMTREVRTIPAEATLREAAEMLTIHGISGAPVVDGSGRMVGVISESDLMNAAKKRAAMPHVAAFGVFLASEETLQRVYKEGATLLTEQVMSSDVVSVPPDAPLEEAATLMLKHQINRIPVVSSEDETTLVGILTREDILRATFGIDAIK